MKLSVKLSSKQKKNLHIGDKVNELLQDSGVRTAIHQEFAETVDPWVPMITGRLSRSGLDNVDASGVHYTAPYAKQEYEATHIHRTDRHPLASSHWDKVAMQTERPAFAKAVKQILQKALKGR